MSKKTLKTLPEGRSDLKSYDIIRYPVITEKSTEMQQQGQYCFIVSNEATKPQIKQAVEQVFGVKVKSVNTMIRKGKQHSFRGHRAPLSDKKRAIVRLEEGESITLVSGV